MSEVFDGGRCQVVQTDTPPTLVLEYDGNDGGTQPQLVAPCPSTSPSPWRGEASVEIEIGSMKSTTPATALKLFGVAAIALATYWTVPMLSFLWPW